MQWKAEERFPADGDGHSGEEESTGGTPKGMRKFGADGCFHFLDLMMISWVYIYMYTYIHFMGVYMYIYMRIYTYIKTYRIRNF